MRAQDRLTSPPGAKPLAPARLKLKLDTLAFRQLKAMLQPKGANDVRGVRLIRSRLCPLEQ